MGKLTIATRGSRLALWQAEHIKAFLEKRTGGNVELLVLKTKGDIILDVPLAKVGGKGLFVKEIEEALLAGRADLAVHSMKDVPMELPEGLVLGAVPEREDPTDLFLSALYANLDALPQGARVGTCSLRRQAQLLLLRPDLEIVSLRGNVETRLKKLLDGQFEAIVMAAAGMNRLGLRAPHMARLAPPTFLPACGQGALGIEFRQERADLHEIFAPLNHAPTAACVAAERGFLAGLEGGCQVPIAGFAVLNGEAVTLEGLVADPKGERIIRRVRVGSASKARELGLALAEEIKAAGGADLLAELYTAEDKNGE